MPTQSSKATLLPPMPIVTILDRVTCELEKIGRKLQRLDAAVGALAALATPGHEMFHGLQDLDRASQEVVCLRRFITGLIPHIASEWSVDLHQAHSSVDLEEMAASLATQYLADSDRSAAGECDLF